MLFQILATSVTDKSPGSIGVLRGEVCAPLLQSSLSILTGVSHTGGFLSRPLIFLNCPVAADPPHPLEFGSHRPR